MATTLILVTILMMSGGIVCPSKNPRHSYILTKNGDQLSFQVHQRVSSRVVATNVAAALRRTFNQLLALVRRGCIPLTNLGGYPYRSSSLHPLHPADPLIDFDDCWVPRHPANSRPKRHLDDMQGQPADQRRFTIAGSLLQPS